MIFVVFPAWNEEPVIRPTLLALAQAMRGRAEPYRAILVDDGSTDRTVDEAERATEDSGGALALAVLRHEANRGLGAGLRTGIYWCLDRAGEDDVIVTLDADGTHPPALIPELVASLRPGFDLAIASRYRRGSEVRGVPAYRRALSDAGRFVFQGLFPIPGVRDYTCCFRAYRATLLRRARLAYGDELCTARGFEAVMDLLLKLRPLGVRAVEVPFVLDYGARAGHSKMKVVRTVRTTLVLLLRRFGERFGPHSRRAVLARIAAAERAGASGPGGGGDARRAGGSR